MCVYIQKLTKLAKTSAAFGFKLCEAKYRSEAKKEKSQM